MARIGRQPKVASTTTTTTTKPNRSKPRALSKKQQSKALAKPAALNDTPVSLDIYSFTPSAQKARGDVDPEARAKSRRSNKKGKGRSKDEEDDEDDEDVEAMFKGEEPVEFTGIKPKGLKMGMETDDEVESGEEEDEDEDIDSDVAGSESEVETDLPAKKGGGKKGKKDTASSKRSAADINLDEDEAESVDEEDGDGFYDASEMLDMGLYDTDASEDDSGEDDDEDDEMESLESDEDEDDDSEYEGALEKLNSFVEGLEAGKKRKNDDDEAEDGETSGKKKKRVVLKERTEAYPEGEFVAVGAMDGANDGKVQLDDLLASFAESKNPKLAALRKTLKPLSATASSSGSATPTTSKSHLKTPGALAAPLPARLQDKIDREAAYEQTKEETDKWNETVRRMKGVSGLGVEGARHERLTLPLMAPTGDAQRDANSNEWTANFEPTNQLEASIQGLLAAGQMTSSDLQKAEKQALKALDPEDLAKRQADLRAQRDLMFRAERKAKRVAKIKSKAFRRIHRKGTKGKEGEVSGLSLDELAEMDAIDGGSRAEDEQARREIMRAKERATLKHSSKGGRWSRTDIGGLEGLDEERNSAVREMVARQEALTRRIEGRDDDDNSDSDDGLGNDDDDDDLNEGGEGEDEMNKIRRKAFDELASLEAREKAKEENGPKLKGVLNMKFMRDAITREDRKVQQSTDELRQRLERMDEMGRAMERDDDDDDDEDDKEDGPNAQSQQVQGNTGRMVFGPSGVQKPSTSKPAPADSSTKPTTKKQQQQHTTKLAAPFSIPSSRPSPLSKPAYDAAPAESSNPWLTVGEETSGSKLSRKSNKATFGKDDRSASKMASKVDRRKSKLEEVREQEREDARIEIDPLAGDAITSKSKGTKKKQVVQLSSEANARLTMDDEDVDSSDEEGDVDAQRGKGKTAFEQRELVAKAFAGDDVVADFEEEKRKEIERDAPKEIDNTLPGWGAWSGKGVKKPKKPTKKFITHVPGIDAKDRQDAKFSNVIISERKDKKAAKYLLKDLPFPYTSVAQHEHKLRTPLGPEWSTSTVLRDQTLPSVLIKPGVTIRPVDRKI